MSASASANLTTPTHSNVVRLQLAESENYRSYACVGGLITLVSTMAAPVLGAMLGTFFVTEIGSCLVADKLGWNRAGVVGALAKIALSTVVAFGSLLAVGHALGATIVCSPVLVSLIIAYTALRILNAIT